MDCTAENKNKNMLNGNIIAEKARFFYQEMIGKDYFRASKGWVDNFKKRFGIKSCYCDRGKSG